MFDWFLTIIQRLAISESDRRRMRQSLSKGARVASKALSLAFILKRLDDQTPQTITAQKAIRMPDSPIKVYTDAVNKTFDLIDQGLDAGVNSAVGVADDVAFLKETIDRLQNNPGPISPEDQALLDAAQTRATASASRSSALRDALKALDDATARPTPPVEPPTT